MPPTRIRLPARPSACPFRLTVRPACPNRALRSANRLKSAVGARRRAPAAHDEASPLAFSQVEKPSGAQRARRAPKDPRATALSRRSVLVSAVCAFCDLPPVSCLPLPETVANIPRLSCPARQGVRRNGAVLSARTGKPASSAPASFSALLPHAYAMPLQMPSGRQALRPSLGMDSTRRSIW